MKVLKALIRAIHISIEKHGDKPLTTGILLKIVQHALACYRRSESMEAEKMEKEHNELMESITWNGQR